MRRRFMNIGNSIPLSFEALEDGLSISFSNGILYCINGGTWETLLAGENTEEVNKGSVISFKHAKSIFSTGVGTFSINKKCNVYGLCSSIIPKVFGEKYMTPYLFYELFYGCDTIVDASKLELPATTLAENCYRNMFQGCSSLTTAPELPATTLVRGCYYSMFDDCSSLTTAPELPATTLADWCYGYMFSNCTKLNYIKMLATDISATDCLNNWVRDVSSTGIFVKNPEATWEEYGTFGIPNGWKVVMDGEESNLKSFQVDDFYNVEEFYFEDGMTWGEWVDSEYNSGDYAVDEMDGTIGKLDSELDMLVGWIGNDYGYVLSSDIILEETYYLMQ